MTTEASTMAQTDLGSVDETSKALQRNTRCCFCFPCFGSRRQSTAVGIAWWQKIRTGPIQSGNRWWVPAVTVFQKVREWSEIVAGPRWKTFIRRFNTSRSNNASSHHHHGKFQYDALSYSLNFEEDANRDDYDDYDDDFSRFRNFSSLYASSKLKSTSASTDVGGVNSRAKDVAVVA